MLKTDTDNHQHYSFSFTFESADLNSVEFRSKSHALSKCLWLLCLVKGVYVKYYSRWLWASSHLSSFNQAELYKQCPT